MALPGPGPRETTIRDLGGQDPRTLRRREALQSLGRRLTPRVLVQAAAKSLPGLPALRSIHPRDILPLVPLGLALVPSMVGPPRLAQPLVLLAFGLAIHDLLLVALPRLARPWLGLGRGAALAVHGIVVALGALVGLSSPVLVGVVLFVGGYITAQTLRRVLLGISAKLTPGKPTGVVQAQVDPGSMLMVALALGLASVGLSLVLPTVRTLAEVPYIITGLNLGLVVGLIPTDRRLLASLGRGALARWQVRWTRALVRDVLVTSLPLALVGHELFVAQEASRGIISPSSLVLLVTSYAIICGRQLPRWGRLFGAPNPRLILSLGQVLLTASILVIAYSPPGSFPLIYGFAEALGLVTGIGVPLVWRGRGPGWFRTLFGPGR